MERGFSEPWGHTTSSDRRSRALSHCALAPTFGLATRPRMMDREASLALPGDHLDQAQTFGYEAISRHEGQAKAFDVNWQPRRPYQIEVHIFETTASTVKFELSEAMMTAVCALCPSNRVKASFVSPIKIECHTQIAHHILLCSFAA